MTMGSGRTIPSSPYSRSRSCIIRLPRINSDKTMQTHAMFEKVATDAPSDEDCNEHVRVQQNFHETRSKTRFTLLLPVAGVRPAPR
jgi:hypothetical protein